MEQVIKLGSLHRIKRSQVSGKISGNELVSISLISRKANGIIAACFCLRSVAPVRPQELGQLSISKSNRLLKDTSRTISVKYQCELGNSRFRVLGS